MALNRQTFRTRALTAIIFAVVMLVGLLWNHWSFLVLFSIIHFGCWWEYLQLTERIHKVSFHPYVKLGFMVLGYGLVLWFCGPDYEIGGYGLKHNLTLPVSVAGFVLLLTGIFQKNRISLSSFGTAALGLLYISLSWGMLVDLKSGLMWFPNDMAEQIRLKTISAGELVNAASFSIKNTLVCLLLVFTMWVNDTMAYIVGSLIGKTPFSKISPKKTWEGTLGGIVLAIGAIGLAFSALCNVYFEPGSRYSIPSSFWYITASPAAIAGTFGDLLESKLKRMANVKDSGTLMPGHGGFLDRFDSLLLATPFVWLYVKFLF